LKEPLLKIKEIIAGYSIRFNVADKGISRIEELDINDG